MGIVLWDGVLQGIESSGSKHADGVIRAACVLKHLFLLCECKSPKYVKLDVTNVTGNPIFEDCSLITKKIFGDYIS